MTRGPIPTPGSRNEGGFEWVRLPAKHRRAAPKLPDRPIPWHAMTIDWWRGLWKMPQAQAWDRTGRTLWPLAELQDQLIRLQEAAAFALHSPIMLDKLAQRTATLRARMESIEDRHGLNPQAMLRLRWIVIDETAAPPTKRTGRRATADDLEARRAERRARLSG